MQFGKFKNIEDLLYVEQVNKFWDYKSYNDLVHRIVHENNVFTNLLKCFYSSKISKK